MCLNGILKVEVHTLNSTKHWCAFYCSFTSVLHDLCMHACKLYVPEVGDQVVQKDGSLEPGQVQPRAQPLPSTKGSETAAAHHVPLL